MFDRLKNGEKIAPIVKEVESQITEVHKRADEVIESNQFRVLESFRKHKIMIHILFQRQVTVMTILVVIR